MRIDRHTTEPCGFAGNVENPGSLGPPTNQSHSPDELSLILQELETIRKSKIFSRSRRHAAILSYLVHMKVEGREAEISERSIGQHACDRGAEFDPYADAAVRVEVSRLRSRLETYYATEGADSQMVISLPSGYVPRFTQRKFPAEATPSNVPDPLSALNSNVQSIEVESAQERDTTPKRHFFVITIGVILLFVVVVPIFWRSLYKSTSEPFFVTSYPGSEIEPALSPQRDRVAFAWNGDTNTNFDIYAKPLRGHELVRLTTDPALDHSPAWSPDGRTIAFLRRLHEMRQAVYVVPSEGGKERKIAEIQTMVSGICWTPDSRWLIVSDSPKGVPLGLFLLSVETGKRHQLTGYISTFHPAISPDGRTLAFLQERDGPTTLYFLPLNKNFLPNGPLKTSRAKTYQMLNLKWAPDGRSLVFGVLSNGIWRAHRYWIATAHMEPIAGLGDGIQTIDVLPGERGFLVTRGNEHRTVMRQLLQNVPGKSEPTTLLATQDGDPNVAPDGQQLAFVSMRSGTPTLWISDMVGSQAKMISTADVEPSHVQWSPDSKDIVFTGWKDGRPKIYKASVGRSKVEKLALDDANNSNASYSRDGNWLYFISDISGFAQIWKMPVAGGAPLLVTTAPAENAQESVDGKALLYFWRSDIYRLSLIDNSVSRIVGGLTSNLFRITKNGVYYQRRDSENGLYQIEFQSLSGGPPVRICAPKQELLGFSGMPGFSVLPDESALLVERRRAEINLEVLPF